MVNLAAIKRGARVELARREFFYFCQAMAPDFYQENRQFLVDLCNEMQDFYESDDDILIVNEPRGMVKAERHRCLHSGYSDRTSQPKL
ncbi:hypothetical protein [Paenibacillus sp. 1A_MP2]|uniref:hypothetical protein n=1 Tax=Paenibacillus sp. 1A_MP2 TaxID=3457495 RepID=UPI003FCEDA91